MEAGRVPTHFQNNKPVNRPDPCGFVVFQPVTAKKTVKPAQIGAVQCGLVGSGRFCPPLVVSILCCVFINSIQLLLPLNFVYIVHMEMFQKQKWKNFLFPVILVRANC